MSNAVAMAFESSAAAARLLESVLDRYGSIESFLACLHSDPRAQTSVLPVIRDESGPRVRLDELSAVEPASGAARRW